MERFAPKEEEVQATPAQIRREAIIQGSQEVLPAVEHYHLGQSFIITSEESIRIGDAISRRNKEDLLGVVGDTLSMATNDYRATSIRECSGAWDAAFRELYGDGVSLIDFMQDSDTKGALNDILVNSEVDKLGMDEIEYCKLLETVAVASMPDTGYTSIPTSVRSRTGGSDKALYGRTVSLLNHLADSEPGVRKLREGILAGDRSALGVFMGNLSTARYAQESLSKIESLDRYEIKRHKADISRSLSGEDDAESVDVESLVHILDWQLLTGSEGRVATHKQVKGIIEAQSKTEHQKRSLVSNWCPERLDFLIDIAETAAQSGRDPSILISNRFEEGVGVYVAVEMTHPHDKSKKIVFADNPLSGNALYCVDEVKLENEGRPAGWFSVLGSSRRIARERGAIRKYHSKNWQAIVPEIILMGEVPTIHTEELEVSQQASVAESISDKTEGVIGMDDILRYKALFQAAIDNLS